MTRRADYDGRKQREALRALQRASGRTATEIAYEVGMSDPQYRRYLAGSAMLRVDQLEPFARAFGVTVADLSRRLGLMDDEAAPGCWDLRAELDRARPEDPAYVERAFCDAREWPVDQQRAAVEAIRLLTDYERERGAPSPNRPNPGLRAQFTARPTGT